MASREDLQQAAADVVGYLKTIREYENARVSVIGGLALWTYLAEGRATQDVDFIITIDSAPASVKQKLLSLPNTPFTQRAQMFYYVNSDGNFIQIDITPSWQSPYIPEAAQKLKNIPPGLVPYISPVDLIVFKINSCGLRAEERKRIVDAMDAQNLVAQEASIILTAQQQEIVENSLDNVLERSEMSEEWWRQNLGLP